MFYKLIRSLLFRFDAESVHHFVMGMMDIVMKPAVVRRFVRRLYAVDDARLSQQLWGLDFDNPVGLAAGFDKNSEHFNELHALGFGSIEIGTVTGQGQTGNERPRLFRLPADRGLLNRMGFNNDGSQLVASRLSGQTIEPVLGVNIGKTKVVPLTDAPDDYELSFRRLYPYAGYFVVNVSSPNTPGLRDLQSKEPLTELLLHLQQVNDEMAEQTGLGRRPMLLKFAPDITDGQLDDILAVVDDCELDGVIATNTTIARDGLQTPGQAELGPGGVSGAPLRERSLELIRMTYRKTDGNVPIIGVGGIFSGEDALQTIRAGASLVQVWTGFIYEGPTMVKRINQYLADACERHGWSNISEAVGVDALAGE